MAFDTPQSLQQRELPHLIMDDVWMWSAFSQEKGLYFNGFALYTSDGIVIIDPPSADEGVLNAIEPLGPVALVIVTNRDHERESDAFRRHFKAPVAAHQLDAPLMETPPEQTFQDGQILPDGLQVIHLSQQKSPGESALYQPDRKILILGDALLGKPAGQFSMLPEDKYADKSKALEGLKRLQTLQLPIQTILVGDGEPILSNAETALTMFFSQFQTS